MRGRGDLGETYYRGEECKLCVTIAERASFEHVHTCACVVCVGVRSDVRRGAA